MYQLIDYFIYLFFFNSHISKVYLPREMLEIIFSYLKDELIYKINKKVLVQMLDRKLHENAEIYNNIEKKIICVHNHHLPYKWNRFQTHKIMSSRLNTEKYYFNYYCCESGIVFTEFSCPFRNNYISPLSHEWQKNIINESYGYVKKYTDEMKERKYCLKRNLF